MEEILREALERRDAEMAANQESRDAGREDMEFELGGEYSWDSNVWKDRGMRPKVTINTISTKKHRLANDLRDLNPEIQIIAKDDKYLKQADIRSRLITDIQDLSCAESVYDQCFCQGLASGFSAMRVVTDYERQDSFDQSIKIESCPNNMAVHWDHECLSPSYIDMKWGIIESRMSHELFKTKYDGNIVSSFVSDAFGDTDMSKSLIVGHYYRIYEKPAKTLMLTDGITLIEGYSDSRKIQDALERTIDGNKIWQVIQERKSNKPILQYYLLSGSDILEERKEMLGHYIPIIPYEARIVVIDGKKHLISFIRNLKEPSRMKNYTKSLEVELVALQPLATWTAPMEGIKNYMEYYQNANNRRYPVLPYNHKDAAGNPLPPPQMTTYQGPGNQLAGTFQTYDKDINDISGMYDDNLGAPSQLKAGVAIDLKQSQGNHNNYDFIDNFITRTLNYMGIVLNDLITEVYDDRRELKLIDKNGNPEKIVINSNEEGAIDLVNGEYHVKMVVGKASESQRRASNEMLVNMLDKIPAMQNAAHLIAKNLDNFQDREELVKILKASLPPEILQSSESDPQAVFAMNMQLQQQMQQMMAENEQMKQLIQSMEIDYQKAMDLQKMKSETEIEKATISSATNITVEELKQNGQMLKSILDSFTAVEKQVQDLTAKIGGPQTTPRRDTLTTEGANE